MGHKGVRREEKSDHWRWSERTEETGNKDDQAPQPQRESRIRYSSYDARMQVECCIHSKSKNDEWVGRAGVNKDGRQNDGGR